MDVFYDAGVKLAISAEAQPEALYTSGVQAAEFQRTVSRLIEMQSREYLLQARREQALNAAGATPSGGDGAPPP